MLRKILLQDLQQLFAYPIPRTLGPSRRIAALARLPASVLFLACIIRRGFAISLLIVESPF